MNFKPLKEFRLGIGNDARAMREAYKNWGLFYLAFTKRRFKNFSRGGGNWKALADSTVARRKKPKKGERAKRGKAATAILRDKSSLFNALSVGVRGNLFKNIPGGIRVGFAPTPHPKARVTIQRLAIIHDSGDGVPKREILVEPDGTTKRRMIKEYKKALAKLGKQSERKL